MLFLLFICVYSYAFDYTRKPSPKEWTGFRYFKDIGDLFFALSLIIFPLAIITHFLSYGINYLRNLFVDYASIISMIFSILSLIVAAISGWGLKDSISKRQKTETVKAIQSSEEKIIKQAEELYKQEFYSPALIEMGRLIEIALQKKILDKTNLDPRRYTLHQLLDIGIKNKIIDNKLVSSIKEIRAMRNKAAHLQIKFNKKDAEWALKETNRILNTLDPKNKWD